jgi:hypothetical protein
MASSFGSLTQQRYFDGHERDNVIEERRIVGEIGFVHSTHAPTPEASRAFPSDIALLSTEQRNKLVVFFHDESTFRPTFYVGKERRVYAAAKK